jgi:hypothetical protein
MDVAAYMSLEIYVSSFIVFNVYCSNTLVTKPQNLSWCQKYDVLLKLLEFVSLLSLSFD